MPENGGKRRLHVPQKPPHIYQLKFQSCVNTLPLPHPDAIVIGQILSCLKMVGKGSGMQPSNESCKIFQEMAVKNKNG
jgi:hypothetical protein